MSGESVGWVLRHGPRDRPERAVLITIADVSNRDGDHAHPGLAAMIEGSGYSRSTVLAALDRLLSGGWIEVEEQGGGRGRATVYRVLRGRPPSSETVRSPDRLEDRKGPIEDAKGSDSEQERVRSSSPAPLSTTVTTNGNYQPSPSPPAPAVAGDVRRVFDAWLSSTGRSSRAVLDGKRRGVIERALRLGYPVTDLIAAVEGWHHSPHHRGENERGTVYNELTLLLRDAAHIEQFRDLRYNPPTPPPRLSRGQDAITRVLGPERTDDEHRSSTPIAPGATSHLAAGANGRSSGSVGVDPG